MTTMIYTLTDLFVPLEQWTDTILKTFSKMEIRVYKLDKQLIFELLHYAYTHDTFKNYIVSPLAFKMNFQDLYHAYLSQWER